MFEADADVEDESPARDKGKKKVRLFPKSIFRPDSLTAFKKADNERKCAARNPTTAPCHLLLETL
jgi:hypothetical protein